jgi:hypothetical protein
MGIFDRIFGEEDTQERVDIFPDDTVQTELQKSERYSKFLSETLSSYYGMPMEETDRAVALNEEKRLTGRTQSIESTFEMMFANRLTPEKAQQVVDTYKKNMDTLSVLDNPVVSNEVVKDPSLTDVDKYTRTQAIIDQAASEMAPQEGYPGLAASLVGTVAYGMTGGVVENILTAFGTDMGSWDRVSDIRQKFNAIYSEEDPVKALGLARTYMKEWSELGFFGGNTFRYWQQVQSLKDNAYNENTGFNIALDIAGVVPVTRISKLLPFADDTVSAAAASSGTTAANKAMTTALNNPNTVTNVAQHSAPAMSRVGNTGLHPSLKPTLENEVHNDYLDTLLYINREQYITPAQVKEAGKNYVDVLGKKVKNHVSDYKINPTDKMDNYEIEVMLGKKDGTKFADQASAKKFGDTLNKELGLGVEVKEVITNSVSDGWVVSYKRNLPLKNFADPTNPSDLREYGVFNALFSPEVTSSKAVLSLRKSGVIKTGSVEEQIFNQAIKVMDKVSSKDWTTIDSIVQDIHLKGYQKEWLNIDEFKSEYFRLTKREASDNTFQTIDQDVLLKAKGREKDLSFRGSFDGTKFYTMKFLNKGNIARLKNDPNAPIKSIVDMDTGKVISAEDFLKDKNKVTLFKLEDVDDTITVGDKVTTYVTGTVNKSRPLTHSDLFQKIAGGYKDSAKLDGYIMQRRLVTDISGNTLNKLPRIIAAGRTKQELGKILNDLNDVISVYKFNPADDIAIETALKAKNGFDPSITTADDLRTFIKNTEMDIDQPFEVVGKFDDLPEVGVGNLESYFNGKFKTYDDLYRRGSTNSVVYGYGNFSMNQLDPSRAITRDFAKAVNYFQGRAYYVNAIEGLIRGADAHKLLDNTKDILNKPLYVQIRDAQFKVGKEGDLLRREQKVILQALNEEGQGDEGLL